MVLCPVRGGVPQGPALDKCSLIPYQGHSEVEHTLSLLARDRELSRTSDAPKGWGHPGGPGQA